MKLYKICNKISLLLHVLASAAGYFVMEAICRHSFIEAWNYMTQRPLVFAYNAAFIFTSSLIVYLFHRSFREAAYVFYRNGLYYFMWSVDDTGSPNYHVAYGTSKSPLGPIKVAKKPVVLIQDPAKEIYGPAHNAVLQIPGTDEWYIVYHRINKNFIDREKGPGVHREVCIDRMEFNPDGTIRKVVPTL